MAHLNAKSSRVQPHVATILISSHNITHFTEVCSHISLLEEGKLISNYDNVKIGQRGDRDLFQSGRINIGVLKKQLLWKRNFRPVLCKAGYFCYFCLANARVAELVDAHDSGSCPLRWVQVRFLSRALSPFYYLTSYTFFGKFPKKKHGE